MDTKEMNARAYRFRGVAMAPLYLAFVLVVVGETEWDAVLWPVGLSVFAAGLTVRVWAQTHLHYRLRERKVLTLTGPYNWVRNPIYIANSLMLLGLTILSELLWMLPLVLGWCALVYSLVVRHEEAHLLEKYGESYRDFAERVPRWMPRRPQPGRYPGFMPSFLRASLVAEAPCLLLLLPLAAKELLLH